MNNHEFDNIIKQSAQQREADVPNDIWENISAKKKRRKRFPFFWLILSGLILTGIVVTWNIENNPVKSITAATENPGKAKASMQKNGASAFTEKADKQNQSRVINPVENKKPGAEDNNRPTNSNSNTVRFAKNNKPSAKEEISADFKSSPAAFNTYESNVSSKKTKVIVSEVKKIPDDDIKAYASKEKIFASSHTKRSTKGKTTVAIINAESENAEEAIETKNIDQVHSVTVETISVQVDSKIVPYAATKSLRVKDSIDFPGTKTDSLAVKKIAQIDSALATKPKPINQQKPSRDKKSSGLLIEAGFTAVFPIQHYNSPLFVKRLLNTTNAHHEFISNSVLSSVEPGTGISARLVKQLNKKWSVGSGLQYSRFTESLALTGIEIHTSYTIVQRLVVDPGGSFLKTDTVSSISKDSTTLHGRNIYHNVSIPVLLRYQFMRQSKLSASINAGINVEISRSYQNNIPGTFETKNGNGTVEIISKNNVGISAFVGLYFSGKFYRKYSWFVAGDFSYSFSPYKMNALSFGKKIQVPGVAVGLSYQLKK